MEKGLIGGLEKVKELYIGWRNSEMIGKKIDIDRIGKELIEKKDKRNKINEVGMDKSNRIKKLINSEKKEGEEEERIRENKKMNFEDGEIMEVEEEIRSEIGIGGMLMRK